jgi:hypothetical protein
LRERERERERDRERERERETDRQTDRQTERKEGREGRGTIEKETEDSLESIKRNGALVSNQRISVLVRRITFIIISWYYSVRRFRQFYDFVLFYSTRPLIEVFLVFVFHNYTNPFCIDWRSSLHGRVELCVFETLDRTTG